MNGAGEVEAAARELGYPDRPVCFKPVFSSGSRGFRILDPTVDRAHQLLHERPGSVAMRLEEAARAAPGRGRPRPARDGARHRRRAHDRRDRGRPPRRPRPPEDPRGDARRARDVLRHARRPGADGDRRPDRRGARDRVVLQHPARGRARDRDQPAHLHDRLPGGPQPPLARRQARARRDLGRGARRAPQPRAAGEDARSATSTSSSSTRDRLRRPGSCCARRSRRWPRRCRARTSRSRGARRHSPRPRRSRGTAPTRELRALALRAVERVAESSQLRELGDDDARIDGRRLRSRCRRR